MKNINSKKKEKVHSSVFRITLSSNYNDKTMPPELKRRFDSLVKFIFSKEAMKDFLFDMNSQDDSTKNIKEFNSDFIFETESDNPKFNVRHTHGFIHILHTGFYRFKTPFLRKVAKEFLGYNPFVSIKASSDSNHAWQEYMRKHQ